MLILSILSDSSFPFKTGWKSNERAIVLHQQINKQWNDQPGIYSGFQIEQTLSITKSLLKRWTNREVVISVSASSLISFGVSVSKIGTINSIFIDKIDNPNWNIDNYRLLTPNSFIEFYRISKKLIDFYWLLSNVIDYRYYRMTTPGITVIYFREVESNREIHNHNQRTHRILII